MLEALKMSMGIVTTACEKAGVLRKSHYEWLIKDEKYRKDVEDILEMRIDFAESKLQQLINGVSLKETKAFVIDKKIQTVDVTKSFPPDAASIAFFLKTKGKKRGYVEKTEVELSGGINFLPKKIIIK